MELKHPFIQVINDNKTLYGGSQSIMSDKTMRSCGCGVISAVDVLLYMKLYHKSCGSEFFSGIYTAELEADRYERLAEELRKSFFPIIPHFGINGLAFVAGLNLYFRKYGIPMKASLGAGGRDIFDAIDDMLLNDIPVILAVGPNFPNIFGKQGLDFYYADSDACITTACKVKAHYVTVTGSDDSKLTISSWGRKYCIYKDEFTQYIKNSSTKLFSTILWLRSK